MAIMAASTRMLPIAERVLAHRRTMGSSIWEYLWLLPHVTLEGPASDGKYLGVVEDGNPVPTNRIAFDLKRSREATLANLERLEAGNYIERSAAVGHAYEYRVQLFTE
jgi:hypothetical protein